MDTLKILRDEVLYQLDEPNDTGSVKTNVNNAINQAQMQRASQQSWPFLIWPTAGLTAEQFTTTTSTGYSLHAEFMRPFYFRDTTANVYLVEIPSRDIGPASFEWQGIDLSTSMAGRQFTLWGQSTVQNQPTSSSVLTISSSSVSDIGSTKSIIVKGETVDGITTDTIVPNGTTPVAGLVAFTRILAVTKSTAWAGTMTMTSNGALVTNLKLFASEFGRIYPQLNFVIAPATGHVVEYRFYRRPMILVNDNDIPDIPPPFSKVLVWDALLILAAYDGRIDNARMAVWRDNQQRLDLAMQHAFIEGQSLEAMPRYVRYINSDF